MLTKLTSKHLYKFTLVQQSNQTKLYLFPGQGTQQKQMLQQFINDPIHNTLFAQIRSTIGISLDEIGTNDPHNLIHLTEYTQPLLVLSHYLHFITSGHHNTLQTTDYMIGHSIGQYSALVASRSLHILTALQLVRKRGQLMQKYTTIPHSMLIIRFSEDKEQTVRQLINQHDAEIACINTSSSWVIAGLKENVIRLADSLKKIRVSSIVLPVSTAFHCRMLATMQAQFQEELKKVHFDTPVCTVLQNYDGKPYTTTQNIRQSLLLQLTNPVQFYLSVQQVPLTSILTQISHKPSITRFVNQIRYQLSS